MRYVIIQRFDAVSSQEILAPLAIAWLLLQLGFRLCGAHSVRRARGEQIPIEVHRTCQIGRGLTYFL